MEWLFIISVYGLLLLAALALIASLWMLSELAWCKFGILGSLALTLTILFVWQWQANGNSQLVSETESYQITESYPIEALQPKETINGRISGVWIAFSGSLESSTDYIVLVRETDGGLTRKTFPASRTKIYEVEEDFRYEAGNEITSLTYRRNDAVWFIGGKEYTQEYKDWPESYKVYIPKGSIILDSYDAGWNG